MKRKPLAHTEGHFDVTPFWLSPVTLFEAAPEELARQLVEIAGYGGERAQRVRRWLDQLVFTTKPKNGVTRTKYAEAATFEQVLRQLIEEQAAADVMVMYALTEKRLVREHAYGPCAHDVYATAFLRVIDAELLHRIKYCALATWSRHEPGCGRLFFGDPRSRWCSEACGSVYRQRVFYRKHPKRKRDRR